ncbi:Winged helix DNA-binding domain [Pelomyxa schiedti]|nr:Winged helix DNA-binding domain [Pelomyxa schiedti]
MNDNDTQGEYHEPHNKKPRTLASHNKGSSQVEPGRGAGLATRVQYHLAKIQEPPNEHSDNHGIQVVISAKDQFIALAVGAMIERCAGFHGSENGSRRAKPTVTSPTGMARRCGGSRSAARNYGSAIWSLSVCPGVLSVLGQEWVLAVERRAAFTVSRGAGFFEWDSPPAYHCGRGTHIYIEVSYTLGVTKCSGFFTPDYDTVFEGYIGTASRDTKLSRASQVEIPQNTGGETTSASAHGGGGDERILISKRDGSVVDVVDCRGCVVRNLFKNNDWGLFYVKTHCNSHWVVLHSSSGGKWGSVLVWKVVDGLPEGYFPHTMEEMRPLHVCFSGWSCDVLLLFGYDCDAKCGTVTLVDLKESFETDSLVILQELRTLYTMDPVSPVSNRAHKIGNGYPIDVISATQFCVSGIDNTPVQIYTLPDISTPSLTLWPRKLTEPEPAVLAPCKIPFRSGIVAWRVVPSTQSHSARTVLTDLATGALLAIIPQDTKRRRSASSPVAADSVSTLPSAVPASSPSPRAPAPAPKPAPAPASAEPSRAIDPARAVYFRLRRAGLARGHGHPSFEQAADASCGLQAQELPAALLSLAARVDVAAAAASLVNVGGSGAQNQTEADGGGENDGGEDGDAEKGVMSSSGTATAAIGQSGVTYAWLQKTALGGERPALVRTYGQRNTIHIFPTSRWHTLATASLDWNDNTRWSTSLSSLHKACIKASTIVLEYGSHGATKSDLMPKKITPTAEIKAIAKNLKGRKGCERLKFDDVCLSRILRLSSKYGLVCIGPKRGSSNCYIARAAYAPHLAWPSGTPNSTTTTTTHPSASVSTSCSSTTTTSTSPTPKSKEVPKKKSSHRDSDSDSSRSESDSSPSESESESSESESEVESAESEGESGTETLFQVNEVTNTSNLELVRLWFHCYAPGTEPDLRRFFGVRATLSKSWIKTLTESEELVKVECGDRPGLYALASDLGELAVAPPATADPPVIFLPRFDSLTLAHSDKTWMMDKSDISRVFRPAAQILAIVLVGVRAVGTWAYSSNKCNDEAQASDSEEEDDEQSKTKTKPKAKSTKKKAVSKCPSVSCTFTPFPGTHKAVCDLVMLNLRRHSAFLASFFEAGDPSLAEAHLLA